MTQQTSQLALRLRISPGIPFLNPDRERWIFQEFEDMLEKGTRLVKVRCQGEKITKLCSADKIAYLLEPLEQNADWSYDLGLIREIEEYEKQLIGECVGPGTVLLPSRHRPPLNLREIVVVINSRRYEKFAPHVKYLVDIAWRGLKHRRRLRSIGTDVGYTLFLLSSENRRELAKMEEQVSRVLEQTEVGYLTSDRYEVSQLKSMLDLRDTVRQRK